MSDKLTDAEIEELRAKKQTIHDELYDKVTDIMKLEPEQGITPDAWVIIEIKQGEQFQKILSGWSGSYLYGDSWRLSSPIKNMHIDIDKDYITVETDSGSVYNLRKESQGLRMSNAGIWNELKEKFGDMVEIVKL